MRLTVHDGHPYPSCLYACMPACVSACVLIARPWLMKSEPNECSIDDPGRAQGASLPWTGARDHQARNVMRDQIQRGDHVLFHHSSCAQPGIAGLATINGEPAPDATHFDRASPTFDARSNAAVARWLQIDVTLDCKTRLLRLAEMRATPWLSTMRFLHRGNRLSITPVTDDEWQAVLALLD